MQAGDLKRLELLEKSYRADNARLERFRPNCPPTKSSGTNFLPRTFIRPAPDIRRSAKTSENCRVRPGLRSDTITFHQHTPDARGLMEVDITTAVEGDYDSLIQFLNKLEHSDNFYVLDSLALASSSAGKFRLNVQLRTYFRTT